MLLGENNLICVSDTGKMRFIKKLDYTPVSFCNYRKKHRMGNGQHHLRVGVEWGWNNFCVCEVKLNVRHSKRLLLRFNGRRLLKVGAGTFSIQIDLRKFQFMFCSLIPHSMNKARSWSAGISVSLTKPSKCLHHIYISFTIRYI